MPLAMLCHPTGLSESRGEGATFSHTASAWTVWHPLLLLHIPSALLWGRGNPARNVESADLPLWAHQCRHRCLCHISSGSAPIASVVWPGDECFARYLRDS